MKKLTPQSAKDVAEEYFLKHKDKSEQDFTRVHTTAVVEIGILLSKKFKVDTSTVEASAWVHDIGSVVERTNHASHSLDLLRKEGFEIDTLTEDCILNHGNGGNPKSEEAKLLQMADKLSILSIPVLKLLLEQKNILLSDVDFINKMTTGAIEYLKKLSTNQ